MNALQNLPLEDQCLVHRYLYHVLSRPIIGDSEYDNIQKQSLMFAPLDHPVHQISSNVALHYPQWVIEYCVGM